MRKFQKTTGGLPLYADDLEWIVDGARDTANAIASGIGNNFILSGCEITQTPTLTTITAGLIYLNGTIYRVQAQSLTTSARDLSDSGQTAERANKRGVFFTAGLTTDAGGDRLVNGSNFSPWRVYTATLNFSASNNAYIQGLTGWHISTMIRPDVALSLRVRDLITEYIRDQSVVLETGDIAVSNGWVLGYGRIERDFLGRVTIDLVLDGSSATSTEILTIPAGFAPVNATHGTAIENLTSLSFVIQYPETYPSLPSAASKLIAVLSDPTPVLFRVQLSYNAG